MKNFLLSILLETLPAASESLFRTSGKIFVVVGIIAIIFLCIVFYLIKLDNKISRLENNQE
jgi:hypothetical protein